MSYSEDQLDQIEFKGDKKFLSNMFPCEIIFDSNEGFDIPGISPTGLLYRSSEHLYQALKSNNILWHNLLLDKKPEETKTLARKRLKTLMANEKDNFLIREDWHEIKVSIMELVLTLKFKQNQELLILLKKYSGNIEERNCWNDRFWGTVHGTGENNLGKLLMKVKEIL